MKFSKILLAILTLTFASSLFAHEWNEIGDWAEFKRYNKANGSLQEAPKVVFMGDSITDGWAHDRKDFFKDNNYVGRGISGQVTSQMLVRFRKDVIDLHPKAVMILAGTNDIAQNNGIISLENIFGNIQTMCEIAKLHKIKPVLCSVLPAAEYRWRKEIKEVPEQIIKLNSMLKTYAKKKGYVYIDLHKALTDENGGLPQKFSGDGVHPNKEAQAIMESIVKPILDKVAR